MTRRVAAKARKTGYFSQSRSPTGVAIRSNNHEQMGQLKDGQRTIEDLRLGSKGIVEQALNRETGGPNSLQVAWHENCFWHGRRLAPHLRRKRRRRVMVR